MTDFTPDDDQAPREPLPHIDAKPGDLLVHEAVDADVPPGAIALLTVWHLSEGVPMTGVVLQVRPGLTTDQRHRLVDWALDRLNTLRNDGPAVDGWTGFEVDVDDSEAAAGRQLNLSAQHSVLDP